MAIKTYLNENKADMDHAEKVSTRGSADQATMLTDHAERRRQLLDKLVNSPYFGRIGFIANGQPVRKPYYVGIHSFADSESDTHLVQDWRAPVSSIFYHYETGPAGYDAPDGRVDGEVLLKRQFRVERGEEMIREITMEELATRLLAPRVLFQSFSGQVAKLLENNDSEFEERILLKSEPEFFARLEEYARLLRRENVMP